MKKRNKGAAMVIVLVTLIFLAGLSIALIYWLWSSSKQTTQKRLKDKAVYLAEAGRSKAINRLQTDTVWATQFTDTTTLTDMASFDFIIDGSSVTVIIEDIP